MFVCCSCNIWKTAPQLLNNSFHTETHCYSDNYKLRDLETLHSWCHSYMLWTINRERGIVWRYHHKRETVIPRCWDYDKMGVTWDLADWETRDFNVLLPSWDHLCAHEMMESTVIQWYDKQGNRINQLSLQEDWLKNIYLWRTCLQSVCNIECKQFPI